MEPRRGMNFSLQHVVKSACNSQYIMGGDRANSHLWAHTYRGPNQGISLLHMSLILPHTPPVCRTARNEKDFVPSYTLIKKQVVIIRFQVLPVTHLTTGPFPTEMGSVLKREMKLKENLPCFLIIYSNWKLKIIINIRLGSILKTLSPSNIADAGGLIHWLLFWEVKEGSH